MHWAKPRLLAAALAGAVCLLISLSAPAFAQKRVALVIGNSRYQNVPLLANPWNDASAVAQMLKNAGFDSVDLQIDVGNLAFKRAIRSFEDVAANASIAVIYFAGHGFEIRGTNYMIPVDAKLADERDAPDEAIPLDRLVEAVEGATQLRLIIVDACRDNPFVRMRRMTAMRTVSRGLARIEPGGTDTLIAYAAKAGSTAEDGHGSHSPLTTALLDNLTVPGLDIRLAFGRVRDEVMKITNNRQEPFVYGSLGGGVVSLVPPKTDAPPPRLSDDARADYELVKEIGTRDAWEVYLKTYKTGLYAELAKAQLKKLKEAEKSVGAVASLETETKFGASSPRLPASVAPAQPSVGAPVSDESLAWEKIKDTADQGALQAFIKRYPNSPLALNAQRRLDTIQEIAKENEKAAAERQKAAEAARQKAAEAERQKAAEAARQKAAEAERQKAAEAERQKAAEAARQKAAEAARQKAAEAERQKAAEAARQKAAEAERQKAAEAERQKAAEAERQKAAEAARQKAAQSPAQTGPAAGSDKLAMINPPEPRPAVGSSSDEERAWDQVKGTNDEAALQSFVARFPNSPHALDAQRRLETILQIAVQREQEEQRRKAEQAAAPHAQSPQAEQKPPVTSELVHSAQLELLRLGCFSGDPDGTMNEATSAAVKRYLSQTGRPDSNIPITDGFVSQLRQQQQQVCPSNCPAGQAACIANAKPAQIKEGAVEEQEPQEKPEVEHGHKAKKARQEHTQRKEAKGKEGRRREAKQNKHAPRREAAAPRPQVRQEVSAGSGGSSHAIGVGF